MNLMNRIMFNVGRSRFGFDETVAAVTESAKENGWEIPWIHDLQSEYHAAGHEDMTRVNIIYFCNPDGGNNILCDDRFKEMSVIMPMGVSVFETTTGEVRVASWNLGLMSMMYSGAVKRVLKEGAENLRNTLKGIVEKPTRSRSHPEREDAAPSQGRQERTSMMDRTVEKLK